MTFKINHIQHIGIPVTNLERSEAFYKGLGFENVMNASFEQEGERGTVAMMASGSMIIEIYQMPEKELIEIRNRHNGHIDHIAFDVADIDQAFASLKAASYLLVEPAPVFLPFWKNGCKYFNIIGPDGERLEFNQLL